MHVGNMKLRLPLLLLCATTLAAVAIAADPAPAQRSRLSADRGQLLYDAGCGECHTTQPHWREKHIVKTWPELLFQVERWQRVAGRGWTAAEIEDVAAYLNHRFYRMPCEPAGCLAAPA
jgi:mono/diheme cytochrome c family protein